MAWPTISEYGDAPGYSKRGTFPWNGSGSSPIYAEWMGVVNNFMNTAIADVAAATSLGWVASGGTYTGTSAPAGSSTTGDGGGAGFGHSVFALVGIYSSITYYFSGVDVTTDVRWVEDSPYIPAGRIEYTGNMLSGSMGVSNLWAKVTELTGVGLAGGIAGNDGVEATANAIAAITPLICTDIGVRAPNGDIVYITAVFDFGSIFWYQGSTIGSPGVTLRPFGYQVDNAPAVDGVWHREQNVHSPVANNVIGASATYISSSDPSYDPIGTPPKIKTRALALSANGTGGLKYPNVNILNICGGGSATADTTTKGAYHPAVEFAYTLPGSTYILQDGTPLQGYNTLKGALVYDLALKKWGKMKQDYTVLVPFSNINANYSNKVSYTNRGVSAGILKSDGYVYILDDNPADGFIRYGKMGYYRLGTVQFLESRVDFRTWSSGSITIDSSLDGRNLDAANSQTYNYSDVLTYRMYPNMNARWFTIKISGKYDLQYMEVRGNISGRR